MDNLLNILLVVDLNSPYGKAMEQGLRKIARVVTIGVSNEAENLTVDYEAPGKPDIKEFIQQLPASLTPHLMIWAQPLADIVPVEVDRLFFPTLALIDRTWDGLDGYLTLYNVGVSLSYDIAKQYNIPYVPLFSSDDEPELSYEMTQALLQFSLNDKMVEHPQHYIDILSRSTNHTSPPPHFDTNDRSFIIPVLDESPASPNSVGMLLDDLASIDGEVICIFNNKDMSDKYSGHPAITRFCTMSDNIGVGRAWNTGVLMSTKKVVIFLNADMRIGATGVTTLHRTLLENPGIGAIGPCGGNVDYNTGKDVIYYPAEKALSGTLVDQVSFFYFAMRRELFYRDGFSFYSEYLPCFMEEWDSALTLRSLGYFLYRVSLDDFQHQLGGSTKGYEQLSCLGSSYSMTQVLENNKQLFRERWQGKYPSAQCCIPHIGADPFCP